MSREHAIQRVKLALQLGALSFRYRWVVGLFFKSSYILDFCFVFCTELWIFLGICLELFKLLGQPKSCLLYTSPSPRD